MIHFSCKWCGKRYRTSEKHIGRSDPCKACGRPVWVPRQSQAPGPGLHFSCPGCGKRYRSHPRYAGMTMPCRSCGHAVTAAAAECAGATTGDDSPFEIESPDHLARLAEVEAFLNLPPFELTPDAAELPEAEFVEEAAGAAEAPTLLYSAGSAEAETAAAAPSPAAPPAPGVPPASQAPLAAAGEPSLPAAEPARAPESAPARKGCPHCGALGTYNLHGRSPLGLVLMVFGTIGGMGALAFVEQDWRYGLAAGAAFALAITGAFLKRWTIHCSQCERRLF